MRAGTAYTIVIVILAAVLTVTATAAAEGPATGLAAAVQALATRLLGDRASAFEFAVVPANDGEELFEVEAADGKVVIRGSSAVAMASGLNWYLKYPCDASVSWCGNQLTLPTPLPAVKQFRKTTPYTRRYYFNYCTFSYTMAWWDWARWEREIDWMALHGVNMPLSVTGQEAIWQTVYRSLGLTDDELNVSLRGGAPAPTKQSPESLPFFVGPAYLPFGWMGCIDGWAGPLSQSWIDEHKDLEKRIVARERELGMTPVLQGFTGHVPAAIKAKFPKAKLRQVSDWCGFPATYFLDPTDPLFEQIGKAFIEEQTRQYGTNHLYAADTFIEMSPPSNDPAFLTAMGKAVHAAMAAADPEAVWVMQGWIFVNNPEFWKPPQAKALLGAVPDDRMILLDLFCETKPTWTATEAFYGKPWVWCIVHNFGGVVNLQGNLAAISQGPPAALKNPQRGKLAGLGMTMEGIEQNPIVYDLMTEMTWRTEPPDLKDWVRQYALRRYGKSLPKAEQAWTILLDTAYNQGGSPVPAICARPTLSSSVCTSPPYDPQRFWQAWKLLLECAEDPALSLRGDAPASTKQSPPRSLPDTYRYDLVTVGRQALADLSGALCAEALDAYKAKDLEESKTAAIRFLDLIRDLDTLLATRSEFLLGTWLDAAARWARTDEEKPHYLWNARNQITLWGPRSSVLHEYAHKQWSGLLTGFYLARWQEFFRRIEAALESNTPVDLDAFNDFIMDWEDHWTHGTESYPSEPRGDAVVVARDLMAKYAPILRQATQPDAPNLTTGMPCIGSTALPDHPARLASDGRTRDTNQYWATDVAIDKSPWWKVDIGVPKVISRVIVIAYFGDERYYGFTVETSVDDEHWEMACDRRDNKAPSTREGYLCKFDLRLVRYIRVNMTHNSANTGRHLVEIQAFRD